MEEKSYEEIDRMIKDWDLIGEILQLVRIGMLIVRGDTVVWAGGDISDALGVYKSDGSSYKPNELCNKELTCIFPRDIAGCVIDIIKETNRTGEPQSVNFETMNNDESKWYMIRTIRSRDGNYVICVCRNLTSYESDQAQIALTNAISRLLFDIVADILVAIDKSGRIIQASDSFSKILSDIENENEVIGKQFFEFISNETRDDFLQRINNLVECKEPFNMETRILAKDCEIPIEIRGFMTTKRLLHENIIWLLIRDISERKHDEKVLKLTAETATLYLDILGHDIRNYMQAIISGIEILGVLIDSSQYGDTFSIIIEAIEKIQRLIKRSQATKGFLEEPLSEVDCVETLKSVADEFRRTFNDVIIDEDYRVERALIQGDKFAPIIFRNIIENAIMYNSNNEKRVWINLKRESRGYTIFVEDNGPGLKSDRKKSLLDPTRRYGGIGIHQAKSIIIKYGGTIEVNDRVKGDSSQGTSFRIWLPGVETKKEW